MRRRTFLFVGGMAASVGAARALRPKPDASHANRGKGMLERALPDHFGEWQDVSKNQSGIVSPDVQAQIDTLYSDTLARSYANRRTGDVVMLSLAYGENQSRSLRVHKPETCYSAQGFQISSTTNVQLTVLDAKLRIMQLVATQGSRVEYISYWIRSGDDIVRGWIEQNLSTLKHGLKGVIPDGILVRVSTIKRNVDKDEYAVHADFIRSMLTQTSHDTTELLVGRDLRIA